MGQYEYVCKFFKYESSNKNFYNSVGNNSKKFNDYTALKLRASDELKEAEPGFRMNIK